MLRKLRKTGQPKGCQPGHPELGANLRGWRGHTRVGGHRSAVGLGSAPGQPPGRSVMRAATPAPSPHQSPPWPGTHAGFMTTGSVLSKHARRTSGSDRSRAGGKRRLQTAAAGTRTQSVESPAATPKCATARRISNRPISGRLRRRGGVSGSTGAVGLGARRLSNPRKTA